jgi:ATP-dependent 26S proteasome regulatory subunit
MSSPNSNPDPDPKEADYSSFTIPPWRMKLNELISEAVNSDPKLMCEEEEQKKYAEFKAQTRVCSDLKKRMKKTPVRQSQEASRLEVVPKEFTYSIMLTDLIYGQILAQLGKDYPDAFSREASATTFHRDIEAQDNYALPYKGIIEVGGHTIWIMDHHKSEKYYFSFYSKGHYIAFMQDLRRSYLASLPKPTEDILLYRFSAQHAAWIKHGECPDYSSFGLIGYTSYLEQVKKEIGIHTKNMQLLSSIGESRSLNYALQGPPGVGKTTMIKTLASQLKLPVCIVNAKEIRSNMISTVLNPVLQGGLGLDKHPILVIFEDFDRFLTGKVEQGESVMSQILNALDGFEDKSNIVRFFTANDPKIITECEALANRMSRIFTFDYPTIVDFRAKFDFLERHLREGKDTANELKKEEFFQKIQTIYHLTLRPFTTYIVRYMLEPDYQDDEADYMDLLIDNITMLGPIDQKCWRLENCHYGTSTDWYCRPL